MSEELTPVPCLAACGRHVPAFRADRPCLPCQADALGPLPAPAPAGPPAGIPEMAWQVFAKPDAPKVASPSSRPHGVVRVRRAEQQLQLGGDA
jgi:hypothetical protein